MTAFTLASCKTASGIPDSAFIEPQIASGGSGVPFVIYDSVDTLLTGLAAVRFDEARRFSNDKLSKIDVVYMPMDIPCNFLLQGILVRYFDFRNDYIEFVYDMENATFRSITSASLRRYRNPIDIMDTINSYWHDYEIDRLTWLRYHWVQDGHEFVARAPVVLPEDEVYALKEALINPKPLDAWEIHGNATSVSIQGMENVTIFDRDGREVSGTQITEQNPSIRTFGGPPYSVHNIELYRLHITDDDILTNIGYSWLVNLRTQRRQYVLQPGTYTFRVDGITRRSELLVRHFYNGEIVSSVDFSDKLTGRNISSITLTVTPDASGSGDTLTLNP